MTKTSASSSKSASGTAAKSAKATQTAANTGSKAVAATKTSPPKTAAPAAEAPSRKTSPTPAAKKTPAATSAKPVATGRTASKISTSDNMPPSSAAKVDTKLANAWKNKSGRELTEAELLAMPDAEYMSDKQLDFFRARLEAQKEDLLSNAGETTEHLREDTSIVPDPADRATIEEEHALELRTRDRERKLLKKISQALVRIDAGEYGFCDETGEPIGLGRLLARPTATLSLEAQQRRELKQKMFGD
ncbi:MAG: RNA polymerase-binding protein DksA [Aquabacterium sp.]